MAKPVIWTVDDDPDVLRAVERDLRRQYGDRYKVISADSGASALEAVNQLKLRNEPVALFLVDQRMPRMSGVEFLEQAIPLYPDAKRALLTAYADTDAAIRAINSVQIDHYLMKPWDSPEERLYGVVDDLLDDWQASYHPVFEGVRVIGHRWSPHSSEIRDFLGRNFVPHQWMNIEEEEAAKQLLATTGADPASLPVVVFQDGSFLCNPPITEVAHKLGLKTKAEFPFYDLVVVGAGPAGLAASVYGAADGLHTLLVEREAPGGQAGRSSRIENYLGFPVGLSGGDLARRAVTQARRFGVEILAPQAVKGVRIEGPSRVLTLEDGVEIGCRALIIATGIAFRKLEVPGLEKFTGAGVYYYAPMSEAFSHRDGDVYIVGAANSAGQAAMYFSKYARQVTMLVRGSSLSDGMSQYLENQLAATKNIVVRLNSSVVAVEGADRCEKITIQDNKTRAQETVPANTLLIYAGAIPRTDWLAGVVERDAQGYLISGQHLIREGGRPKGWTADRDPYYLETSVPGIFVAGDVRHRSAKGVTSGVGEGAMAVKLVHEYLGTLIAMDDATFQMIRSAPLFSGLDDEQIACVEGGEIIDIAPGTVLVSEGDQSTFFFLVLEGEVRLTRNYDRQSVLMGAIKPGRYTGETTLLLNIPWLATARVAKPTKLFRLCEKDFWRMLSTCPTVAREIFHSAANKMRNMEGYSQQREKLASLGTMAAGLAHELNNPAAAARRAAAHLQETTDKVQLLQCKLARTLEPDHWQVLLDATQEATELLAHAPTLDHLERSDRAEVMSDWLGAHGLANAWELAPTFVSAGVDTAWLEQLLEKLPAAGRTNALGWLEARIGLKLLLGQVEQSTTRIAELVKAVKSYSYMDQSPMQEVDIHEGLESTLTMLGHKLKNVTLVRAYDRSVPRIMAYGSELNQVWTNLIDNAIHAVGGTGKICIGTSLEDNQLLVEIVDNGAGIPPEVQAHMFEPFFTTKPVGTGTGLGLIISNRIVADRHGGEIEFESRPGETRFKVRLPISAAYPREQPAPVESPQIINQA